MTRTLTQNAALHVYFKLLAEALNDAGLDMRKTLKEGIDIEWTPEMIKTYMWKPVQKAMIDEASTTQLSRVDVSAVYEMLNRHTAEKLGVFVPFPEEEK